MEGKKYLNLDADSSISKKNTIFYNNLNNDKINDDENSQIIAPSIIEDQFLKFEKRNHYIKNTLVLIDSKNRDIINRHISDYINYEKIAILFSNKATTIGKFFFTLFNNELNNEDIILSLVNLDSRTVLAAFLKKLLKNIFNSLLLVL